jgi:hypothetical protein
MYTMYLSIHVQFIVKVSQYSFMFVLCQLVKMSNLMRFLYFCSEKMSKKKSYLSLKRPKKTSEHIRPKRYFKNCKTSSRKAGNSNTKSKSTTTSRKGICPNTVPKLTSYTFYHLATHSEKKIQIKKRLLTSPFRSPFSQKNQTMSLYTKKTGVTITW